VPEEQARYEVAVHVWNDHAYGESFATLRIYLRQVLVAERSVVRLGNSALWHAAYVDWPSGEVVWRVDADGEPAITPDYRPPMFFNE